MESNDVHASKCKHLSIHFDMKIFMKNYLDSVQINSLQMENYAAICENIRARDHILVNFVAEDLRIVARESNMREHIQMKGRLRAICVVNRLQHHTF